MRHYQIDILSRRIAALAGLATLSLLSACASTSLQQSSVMALGPQAPAPMGYLEFCARRPDQCGLSQVETANGAPLDAELRAQDLRRRYYWSVALANSLAPPPRLTPASGVVTAAVSTVDHTAATVSTVDHAMWRGPAPSVSDASAPHLNPATWGGSAQPLLQSAVLTSTPPSDPFQVKAAPAPEDHARDPLDLKDADADAPQPVEPIAVTPQVMTMLDGINRHVNESIRYASARALYGNEDYWTLPLDAGGLRAGDCKDYVLEKRKALVEQGVPSADLSIAVVMLRDGIAHAVLLVATDHGELVMDSLSSWIEPWNKLDYRWISRQAPGQQLVWVKVEGGGRG